MHINTKSHRHFIALPLVALAVWICLGGSSRFSGEVLGSPGNAPVSFLADHMQIVPDGNARVEWTDALTLREGSIVMASDSRLTLHIGSAVLTAFHGAMHLTAQKDRVTVAALTSPVVVRVGNSRILVPIGLQADIATNTETALDDQSFHALPDGFLDQQLERLSNKDATSEVLKPSASLWGGISLLQFPSARNRTEQTKQEEVLQQVATAAKAGDSATVQALLMQIDPATTLSLSAWSEALSAALGTPSITADILPQVQSADLQLLSYFHPDLRLAAWTMDTHSRRDTILRPALLLLPLDDLGNEGLPGFVVERWKADTKQYLATLPDPSEFLSALLWRLELTRKTAASKGYPERIQRYADAVSAFATPYADKLPANTAALIEVWKGTKAATVSVGIDPVVAEPVPESITAESSSSLESLSAAAAKLLDDQTRQAILEGGGLLTIEAKIHPLSATRIELTGVVFASSDGDHQFTFAYDPQTQKVSDIVRDGQGMPYGLSFADFARWARGGK